MTRFEAVNDAATYAVRADGGLVQIRAAHASDRPLLLDLNTRASDRSLYLRFFGLNRPAADKYVDFELRPASDDHQAIVAMIGAEMIGVATYERLTAEEADVALLIDDTHQHLGVGTLLLEHLAALARTAGIRRFVADVLAENRKMLSVFSRFGFAVHRETEQGTVQITCSLLADDAAIVAVDERERSASPALSRCSLRGPL